MRRSVHHVVIQRADGHGPRRRRIERQRPRTGEGGAAIRTDLELRAGGDLDGDGTVRQDGQRQGVGVRATGYGDPGVATRLRQEHTGDGWRAEVGPAEVIQSSPGEGGGHGVGRRARIQAEGPYGRGAAEVVAGYPGVRQGTHAVAVAPDVLRSEGQGNDNARGDGRLALGTVTAKIDRAISDVAQAAVVQHADRIKNRPTGIFRSVGNAVVV